MKNEVQIHLPSVLAYDMKDGENCAKKWEDSSAGWVWTGQRQGSKNVDLIELWKIGTCISRNGSIAPEQKGSSSGKACTATKQSNHREKN